MNIATNIATYRNSCRDPSAGNTQGRQYVRGALYVYLSMANIYPPPLVVLSGAYFSASAKTRDGLTLACDILAARGSNTSPARLPTPPAAH